MQVHLEAEDLSAEVSTPLGHEIYDVLCVYSIMMGMARGSSPSHNLPSAGSPNIEDIFGIARPMWNVLARLANLLAQVRNANPVVQLIGVDTTAQDTQQLLADSAVVLTKIDRSQRSRRIKLGSKVSPCSQQHVPNLTPPQALYHTIVILANVEILHSPRSEPVVQESCASILETLLQINRRERRVGVALPLTVSLLFSLVMCLRY